MANATGAQYDLYAEIKQSVCDKLLSSTSYPFKALENRQNFPGCSNLAAKYKDSFYELSKKEIKDLLNSSLATVRSRSNNTQSVHSQVYSFAGSIIQQAKSVIDAASSAGADYEGPEVKEMQEIVNGGIESLTETLGDFGIYAWNSYLRITIDAKPSILLKSPRIDLNGINIEVTATGELWSKYPWWNCHKWCTKWEKIHKCEKIASLTVSPNLKAEAHADIQTQGARVNILVEFDKLRLAYDILDKIPLEGIANRELKGKPVFIYDASQLVTTVPVLGSKFSIDSISTPPSPDSIGVAVTLKQI